MKKGLTLYGIVWAICFLFFNIVAFISPEFDYESARFWISYMLIVFALLGNLVSGFMALNKNTNAKVFYNIPVVYVSIIGTVISTIAVSVFIANEDIPTWIGIVVAYAVLALTLVLTLSAKAAADIVADTDSQVKMKTYFIRAITADAEHVMVTAQNAEIKADAKKVYEAFHYSDPVNHPAVADIERQIQDRFIAFSNAAANQDVATVSGLTTEILNLVDYRNKKCKLLK